ncbi:NADPH-dependent F420 reductase [Gymnodinialimonas sp.]
MGLSEGERVGSALAAGWEAQGHEVQFSGRDTTPGAPEIANWAEVIVLAVPYAALEGIAATIAAKDKPIIDCTNPIATVPDGMGLAVGHTTSGAEQLQALLPGAHVVKTLNQVGAEVMADTTGFALAPVQFLAGDNEASKMIVSALLVDLGFEPLDAGGLSKARLLEPFAVTWINQAIAQKHGRNWAFGAMPRAAQ